MEALKKCWCSCFSERVMRHRLDNGMPTTGLKMAVIIQVRDACVLLCMWFDHNGGLNSQ